MVKIDLKDRRILYQLDLDSRQPLTQIGKKVGLKKDVVSYRIKRLQDLGIIKNFWTSINTFKLGYNVFRIYITYQYVSLQIKNEIINHFINYKNVWAVISTKGPIDLSVVLWVKNIYEFYNFWDKTLEKFEDYIAKYSVSIYIQAIGYKKSYLLPDKNGKYERKLYDSICDGRTVEIDNIDYNLLNELALNARTALTNLAEKLDCSAQMVNYRIKNLMKKGIIQAFRVNIDLSRLNLQIFKIDINLKVYKERRSIIRYLEKKSNMECLNVAVGWCDLEPEIIVENVAKLNNVMEEIDTQFPGAIRNYDYWIMTNVHKERWLPEL